jgi:hypothetical protein
LPTHRIQESKLHLFTAFLVDSCWAVVEAAADKFVFVSTFLSAAQTVFDNTVLPAAETNLANIVDNTIGYTANSTDLTFGVVPTTSSGTGGPIDNIDIGGATNTSFVVGSQSYSLGVGSGQSLDIGALTTPGILTAIDGGTININGTINAGLIEALSAGTVNLAGGGKLIGTTLEDDGTGSFSGEYTPYNPRIASAKVLPVWVVASAEMLPAIPPATMASPLPRRGYGHQDDTFGTGRTDQRSPSTLRRCNRR